MFWDTWKPCCLTTDHTAATRPAEPMHAQLTGQIFLTSDSTNRDAKKERKMFLRDKFGVEFFGRIGCQPDRPNPRRFTVIFFFSLGHSMLPSKIETLSCQGTHLFIGFDIGLLGLVADTSTTFCGHCQPLNLTARVQSLLIYLNIDEAHISDSPFF